MKNPEKQRYLYAMLAGFGAISLSVVFFFLIFRLQGVGEAVDRLVGILQPFIYGGVIAYLLRPMCNGYADAFRRMLKGKKTKLAEALAVTASIISGLLIVYALIIMIAPQLYSSIASLWKSLPGKVDQLLAWFTDVFGENEMLVNYFDTSYETIYNTLDSWARNKLVQAGGNPAAQRSKTQIRGTGAGGGRVH